MNCCAIADLHGYLPEDIDKNVDYLFIAGDILPLQVQGSFEKSKEWINGEFFNWLRDFKKVILVAGNHDFYLERYDKEINFPDNTVYLRNQAWNDDFISIYGTPQCKPFGMWAFMEPQVIQESIFSKFSGFMEDKVKILISHDAPYGCSDILLEDTPWADGNHIGNLCLTRFIERTKPDLVLHGHLHSTNHEAEYMNNFGTEVRCVSILGEKYKPIYEPYYFNI